MRTINVSFSIFVFSLHYMTNQHARLSLSMNFSKAVGVQGGGLVCSHFLMDSVIRSSLLKNPA